MACTSREQGRNIQIVVLNGLYIIHFPVGCDVGNNDNESFTFNNSVFSILYLEDDLLFVRFRTGRRSKRRNYTTNNRQLVTISWTLESEQS